MSSLEPKRARRPAVFFDRDGTINVDLGYTHRVEALTFLPGAIAAIKRVNDLGYYAFLVTNQSGIARGYFSEDDMKAYHTLMRERLATAGAHLDDIRFCPHHPHGTVPEYTCVCDCRKPKPGMIMDLARQWPIVESESILIGDQQSDMEAAKAAGVRGVLYEGGNLDALLAYYLPRP